MDIERKDRDFTVAAPRFLSDEEKTSVSQFGSPLTAGIVWCAKETLYKLAAGEDTDLLDDIRITGFDPHDFSIDGTVEGSPFSLGMIPHSELFIVYSVGTERKHPERSPRSAGKND